MEFALGGGRRAQHKGLAVENQDSRPSVGSEKGTVQSQSPLGGRTAIFVFLTDAFESGFATPGLLCLARSMRNMQPLPGRAKQSLPRWWGGSAEADIFRQKRGIG